MHLPRETTLLAHETSNVPRSALGRDRKRAPMSVDAGGVIAADTMLAGSLAGDTDENLLLTVGRHVLMTMSAFVRCPCAPVLAKVMLVTHLNLLDAPQLAIGDEWNRRVDALAFLIVASDWLVFARRSVVGLRKVSSASSELCP